MVHGDLKEKREKVLCEESTAAFAVASGNRDPSDRQPTWVQNRHGCKEPSPPIQLEVGKTSPETSTGCSFIDQQTLLCSRGRQYTGSQTPLRKPTCLFPALANPLKCLFLQLPRHTRTDTHHPSPVWHLPRPQTLAYNTTAHHPLCGPYSFCLAQAKDSCAEKHKPGQTEMRKPRILD